jgi:glycosyltransferase involved in cell wall biosynthesis
MPLISVIMPVYNAEKFLKEAIDSILNQTITDFEFIILNDGSIDSSWDIISSYTDPRIKLMHDVVNLGYCARLNEGLRAASGKYIARMDSDDISLPTRFAKQLNFLESNSNFGLCSTNAIVIDENNLVINDRMFFKDNSPIEWQLIWTNPIIHPSVMLRRSFLENNDLIFNAELFPAEDYDLWCRMASFSKIHRLDDLLFKYRVLNGSAYHSNFQKAIDKSIQIEQSYLQTYMLNNNLPWFHFEIVQFCFSGKANFENFDLRKIIKWTSELVEVFNKKYNWSSAELKAININNYQRYISLIKRANLSVLHKVALFLHNIPSDILLKTFMIRIGFMKHFYK